MAGVTSTIVKESLEEIAQRLSQASKPPEIIAGITGYPFILDALSVVDTI